MMTTHPQQQQQMMTRNSSAPMMQQGGFTAAGNSGGGGSQNVGSTSSINSMPLFEDLDILGKKKIGGGGGFGMVSRSFLDFDI